MSNSTDDKESLLPPGGNYRKLFTYQKAEAIYDITFYFCEKYLRRGDRTIDQMVQAARSGKQNIAEGSAASSTSKEMEIKLINVAKASSQELLLDYEDYLRNVVTGNGKMAQWKWKKCVSLAVNTMIQGFICHW
jgi:four helix bundle protein